MKMERFINVIDGAVRSEHLTKLDAAKVAKSVLEKDNSLTVKTYELVDVLHKENKRGFNLTQCFELRVKTYYWHGGSGMTPGVKQKFDF